MIKHAKFEADQSHLMAITFEKNCITIHQWWKYNDVTRTSCNLKPLTARILSCNNGNITAPNYWPFRRESNPLVTGGFPWQRVSIAACPRHDVITGCTLVKSSVALHSLSDKSYRKISWSLETARLVVNIVTCMGVWGVGCGGVYDASEFILKDVNKTTGFWPQYNKVCTILIFRVHCKLIHTSKDSLFSHIPIITKVLCES